jgi:hypothetical protein
MTAHMIGELDDNGVTWTDFGVIPFTNEITNGENFPTGRRFFLHCSTKVLRILTNPTISSTEVFPDMNPVEAITLHAMLKDALFYDEEKFNMAYQFDVLTPYGPLRQYLANGHGYTSSLEAELDKRYAFNMFIKPGKDLKLFNGGVVPAGKTLRELLAEQTVDSTFSVSGKEDVIVAPCVDILAEYRFFVVGELVVAYSQYRKYGEMDWSSYVPNYVVDYAEHLASLYRPAKAYVMDVWLMADLELKIGEYNCINCSGPYHASIADVAAALRYVTPG